MAQMPAGAPPKPANQGSNAAAYTQPLAEGVPNVMGTDNMPWNYEGTQNAMLSHVTQPEPRGFGGSGNGAS
jgi:hypothetical protein